jgi:UDP-N-acetylmuramyl pentapeptide phosphotransferase/UDP-N-acetylglucosamine-1-phosphate transferase
LDAGTTYSRIRGVGNWRRRVAATSGLMAPLVTMLFMFALRPVAVEAGLMDRPIIGRKRGAPVPLIGGTAMVMGLGIGVVLTNQPEFLYPAMLGIYLLMAVGAVVVARLDGGDRFQELSELLRRPTGVAHKGSPFYAKCVIPLQNLVSAQDLLA